MEVNTYAYVEDGEGNDYCFKCAVKQILYGNAETFDLVLEQGETGSGNDMRSAPRCVICGRSIQELLNQHLL